MMMDEKKIIKRLDEVTQNVKVPQKLQPENIMNTIKESKESKKIIPFKTAKKLAALVSAAAVVLVAVVAVPKLMPANNGANSEQAVTGVDSSGESYVIAKTGNVTDYDDVYAELEKYKRPEPSWFDRIFNYGNKNIITNEVYFEEEVMEDFVVGETEAAASATGGAQKDGSFFTDDESGGYSKTNVQTVGIDEADIIKTDGRYIYYASIDMHTVTIYGVNGADTEVVANLYIEGVGSLNEFYLDGDMLLATSRTYRDDKYYVSLTKYDITDRANPKYVGVYEQEGSRVETRKIGDIVYIVTDVKSNVNEMKKDEPETFVPTVCDEIIRAEDIYIPEDGSDGTVYTVISSVDVKSMEKIDTAAVLGFDGIFYMGNESMYIYRTEYNVDETSYVGSYYTDIRRIDYVAENGLIGAVTSGKVPGAVKDTFAINEYNGYLRIMTTSTATYVNNDTVNNVFVLDQNLSVVGSIEGLAKGERIYSARYMGDVAYFVTYRETDPLYSVDLTNPESPKIMGALKIPGFSEYLHGYGDGKLLGIGIEEVENKEGWNNDYIKLSMFDTSDPYNVTEEDKTILNDANYSMALYNYKAVMIDAEKNIFAFITESYDANKPVYRVFSYTGEGFVELVHEVIESSDAYNTRSVYIGDYVYIVNAEGITAYSIK